MALIEVPCGAAMAGTMSYELAAITSGRTVLCGGPGVDGVSSWMAISGEEISLSAYIREEKFVVVVVVMVVMVC